MAETVILRIRLRDNDEIIAESKDFPTESAVSTVFPPGEFEVYHEFVDTQGNVYPKERTYFTIDSEALFAYGMPYSQLIGT